MTISTDAKTLTFQVFAYGGGAFPSVRDVRTSGQAMTSAARVDWRAHRDRPALLRVVRAGEWPSGLYFVRATSADGRVGYAPFIVRPRQLGTHRVAVVLATNTWAAYNFADTDGDGWGDSWYVTGKHRSVDLRRPFLDFGVPFRFHDWDLEFIAWLNRTGRAVDFLSDDDLEAVANGDELARRYDLVVFPGHEEYVTRHAYDVIERYRNDGGNLAFLAANNLYRPSTGVGQKLVGAGWGQAGPAGVGHRRCPIRRVGSRPAQAATPSRARSPRRGPSQGPVFGRGVFGRYGIEIDARTAASPRGIEVLARIPDLLGAGRSAEMTYYETPPERRSSRGRPELRRVPSLQPGGRPPHGERLGEAHRSVGVTPSAQSGARHETGL